MLPYWCVNHGLTISLYYADPDGNVLETQCDVFESNNDANSYMLSPAFQENPIGADFDPEELVARVQAGESWEDLARRPDVGPRGIESVPRPAMAGVV